MLLYTTIFTATMACLPQEKVHNSPINEMNQIRDVITSQSDMKFGTQPINLGRSGSNNTLSNKWQREKDLKAEMMSGITHCLTTRSRPMEKSKQRALEKTEWFTAWDTHCSNQIDLNCPIKAGECWAMGVITCRKNCDAKFLLRGNRGKFKRCIYKQMKGYEKDNVGVVSEQCSVFSANNSLQ